jgi:hypothetical protein
MKPEETRKQVLDMWARGHTSNEISTALSITRNQVMGLVHRAQRMGLAERRPYQSQKPKEKPKPAPVAPAVQKGKISLAVVSIQREPEMPKKPVEPPQPQLRLHQPKTIMQLTQFDCRWIRPDKKYCGHPARSARTPWCDEHYKMVYVPLSNRRGS